MRRVQDLLRPRRAYKLLTLRENGTLGPLFINRKQIIPTGKWLEAEDHPTKGYKRRPGWHACAAPVAPHLTMRGRIWCAVEIADYEALQRPVSQGTTWYIARRMRVLRRLTARHKNPFER